MLSLMNNPYSIQKSESAVSTGEKKGNGKKAELQVETSQRVPGDSQDHVIAD